MTAGLIGPEEVREGAAALTDARKAGNNTGPEVSEAFRGRIEGADDRAVALADFRSCLTELWPLRSERLNPVGGRTLVRFRNQDAAVVIIDELDRCKPTYALDLLENIKHLFDADNLCFVLVTNLEQLGNVVSRKSMDSRLRRNTLTSLFRLRFHLPDAVALTENHSAERTVIDRMEEMQYQRVMECTHGTAAVIADDCKTPQVSLRCIEQVMRNVDVFVKQLCQVFHQETLRSLVAIVCSVKVLASGALFKNATTEMASADAVLACMWRVGSAQCKRYVRRRTPRDVAERYFPPTEDVVGGKSEATPEGTVGDAQASPMRIVPSMPSRILDSFGQHVR